MPVQNIRPSMFTTSYNPGVIPSSMFILHVPVFLMLDYHSPHQKHCHTSMHMRFVTVHSRTVWVAAKERRLSYYNREALLLTKNRPILW